MINKNLKDIILFELENTLVFSCCQIEIKNIILLKSLIEKNYVLALISSNEYFQIKLQLKNNVKLFDYIFSENGMVIYKKYKNNLALYEDNNIQNFIKEDEIQNLIDYILNWISKTNLPIKRGHFINFKKSHIFISPIGFDCRYKEKILFEKYDNIYKIRQKMINDLSSKFSIDKFKFNLEDEGISITLKDWGRNYCLKFINYNYSKIFFFGTNKSQNKILFNNKRIIGFKAENNNNILNNTILNTKLVGEKQFWDWNNIEHINENNLIDYNKLFDTNINWNKLAILKINYNNKYNEKIKFGLTNLQMTIKQIVKLNYLNNTDIPLILINFNQSKLTEFIIPNISIIKIYLIKCKYTEFKKIMNKFIKSDVYLELIQNKKENLFVSSIDNISAIPCEKILSYVQSEDLDLLIEVSKRKYIDTKSPCLIKYKSKYKILRLINIPYIYKQFFYNTKEFKILLTDTYWMKLNSIAIDFDNDNIISLFKKVLVLNVQRNRYVSYKKYKAIGKIKNLLNNLNGINNIT